MSPIFAIRFCCQLNHYKQEGCKKGCIGKFTEIIIVHTELAYSQLIQTSRMESFANMAKC